jgi:hypothetical protein
MWLLLWAEPCHAYSFYISFEVQLPFVSSRFFVRDKKRIQFRFTLKIEY